MNYEKVPATVLYPVIQELKTKIKVLDVSENLRWLLSHFNAEIKYNLMTRRREIYIPDLLMFPDDVDNDTLARIDEIATINNMPTKKLDQHLNTIANGNPYHPIVECIKNKPWDGINRLDKFIKTIKAAQPDMAYQLIRTWMMAAMAAAHSDNGFIHQGVLVLQGEQQIGKTTWVERLDPINCNAVRKGAFLDPLNKDSVAQIASYWIAELGELDSIFKKSEIGRLKSYITTDFDYVRLPYARKATRLARRTAYIATVNEENFLVDTTGNRRWWTVAVEKIDLDHGLDMQQVWAEVYCCWKGGEPTDLSSQARIHLNKSNEDHEKVSPLLEKVLNYFDWSENWEKNNTLKMTSSQVLEAIGYPRPGKSEATEMGGILKKLTKKSPKRGLQRLHTLPRRNITTYT